MIHNETITLNGKQYTKTYSDTHYIMRDGEEYAEAIDPIGSGREYTESERLHDEATAADYETEAKAAAYDILTGVTE